MHTLAILGMGIMLQKNIPYCQEIWEVSLVSLSGELDQSAECRFCRICFWGLLGNVLLKEAFEPTCSEDGSSEFCAEFVVRIKQSEKVRTRYWFTFIHKHNMKFTGSRIYRRSGACGGYVYFLSIMSARSLRFSLSCHARSVYVWISESSSPDPSKMVSSTSPDKSA